MNQLTSRLDSSPSFGIEILSKSPSGSISASLGVKLSEDDEARDRTLSTRIKLFWTESRDSIDGGPSSTDFWDVWETRDDLREIDK